MHNPETFACDSGCDYVTQSTEAAGRFSDSLPVKMTRGLILGVNQVLWGGGGADHGEDVGRLGLNVKLP